MNKLEQKASTELIQLKNFLGDSVFMTDPEGNSIEIKTGVDGSKIVCTRDEEGKSLAIEEKLNGSVVYHISKDSTGLPSSHEIKTDKTEVIYFYNEAGKLEHFVELKTNGDRVSTVICENALYSIEQKQIGGVVFQAWIKGSEEKNGMIWLHTDGEISTYGDDSVICFLLNKFSRFLDGITV